VAGLGMAALAIGLPGLPSLPDLTGRPVPAVAGSAAAGSSAGGSVTGSTTANRSTTATGSTVAGSPGRAASAKRRLSPLIVVGHGVVAVTTMLLVLLAALGVGLG